MMSIVYLYVFIIIMLEVSAAYYLSCPSSRRSRNIPSFSTGVPSLYQTASSSSRGYETTSGSSSSRLSMTSPSEGIAKKRTLYEILGAEPTETRAQLKKRYVDLARKTHPDALVGTLASSSLSSTDWIGGSNDPSMDFSEIAAAWKILSDAKDRKQYDRSLQAEQISEDIMAWASNVTRTAGPAAEISVQVLEKVALPFLRRTTATTLASFHAAVQGMNKKPISQTFQSAMLAARHAGRAVDQLELQEKSQELESRAVQEYKRAMDMQKQLESVAERRLRLALHTTNSGITSAEAMLVLEDFNKTIVDHVTVLDRALMRHSVQEAIMELQKVEQSFIEAQVTDSKMQESYREHVRERLVARSGLLRTQREEEEARRVYEEAQRRVVEQRRVLEAVTRELAQSETIAKKSSYELERKSSQVEIQSERVRHALRQREREVVKVLGQTAIPDSTSEEENKIRLQQLSQIRLDERMLAEESSRLEIQAARLLSRANKLKDRAEEIKEVFLREKQEQ